VQLLHSLKFIYLLQANEMNEYNQYPTRIPIFEKFRSYIREFEDKWLETMLPSACARGRLS